MNMAAPIEHVVIDMHVEGIGGVQKRRKIVGRSSAGNLVARDESPFIRIDAP